MSVGAALSALVPVSLLAQEIGGEEPVDVELVLAVDVSSSMTRDELVLQREGYKAAFRSPDVMRAIQYGRYGRVAVTYVEWGASTSRKVIVPWTLVANVADAEKVVRLLDEAKVRNLFQTSISGAIRYGVRAFEENSYRGTRRVIDISGDGPNNEGGLVSTFRDAAVREGITINGLPMILEGRAFGDETIALLDRYYTDCVIGGPGSFILPVSNWDQFAEAVRWKLILELSDARPKFWRASGRENSGNAATTDCRIGEKMWSGMEQD